MIRLDIKKKRRGTAWSSRPEFDYLTMRQGEAGVSSEFSLTDSGAPLDLTDMTVTFLAWAADGNVAASSECVTVKDASGGVVECEFPNPLQSVVGDCICYFEVYQDDGFVYTTEPFPLRIAKGVDIDHTQALPYIAAIDEIVSQVNERVAAAEAATGAASMAVDAANDAIALAEQATEAATEAAELASAAASTIHDYGDYFEVVDGEPRLKYLAEA